MPAWPRFSNIEEVIPSSGTNLLGGSRAMPDCLSLMGRRELVGICAKYCPTRATAWCSKMMRSLIEGCGEYLYSKGAVLVVVLVMTRHGFCRHICRAQRSRDSRFKTEGASAGSSAMPCYYNIVEEWRLDHSSSCCLHLCIFTQPRERAPTSGVAPSLRFNLPHQLEIGACRHPEQRETDQATVTRLFAALGKMGAQATQPSPFGLTEDASAACTGNTATGNAPTAGWAPAKQTITMSRAG